MATFKVGDRVRIKTQARAEGPNAERSPGREATILADNPLVYRRYRLAADGIEAILYASQDALEPLTPPAADEWAQEKVKQVTRPIHEPIRTKEPA